MIGNRIYTRQELISTLQRSLKTLFILEFQIVEFGGTVRTKYQSKLLYYNNTTIVMSAKYEQVQKQYVTPKYERACSAFCAILSNLVLFINFRLQQHALNYTSVGPSSDIVIIILLYTDSTCARSAAFRFCAQRRCTRCDRGPGGDRPRSWRESAWPI